MNERRKLERFDLRVPAKINMVGLDHERETLNLMTKDICAGGAFFQTPDPLPKGTQVKIDMILDRGLRDGEDRRAHIKLGGAVLRSESTGMAICFDKGYKILPLNKP
ncbi:MAG: PilZ domain-containing protein [Desulfobacteraceae bacterium]|nr:MAG: PilZ domain-containing protein [Desulfobacteraceae bacterium]